MAAAGAVALLGLGVGALLVAGGGKKASADTGTGGTGGGGSPPPPVNACEQAIAALPAELRGPVLKLWGDSSAGGLTAAQLTGMASQARSLADVLTGAANVAPANQAANLRTVAGCLRDRATELDKQAIAKSMGGGGAPAPTGGGGAPAPAPAPAPSSGGFPTTVLVPTQPAPPTTGTAQGPALVDHNGVPSSWDGGPRYKGVASNPYFTWKHVVKAGQSPSAIVAAVFGADSLIRRRELIEANPREFYTGRELGAVGTPGTNAYNFASLQPNDVLLFPRSWDPWVDQDGYFRGKLGPAPWPQPNGSYDPTPAPPMPVLSGGK